MITRSTGRFSGAMWCLYIALGIVISTTVAADGTFGATVNGVPIGGKTNPPPKPLPSSTDRTTDHTNCINHCSASSSRCDSAVRRARSDCSRIAASGGRDPMGTMTGSVNTPVGKDPWTGNNYKYAYFCDHFNNPRANCGSDRYAQACQMRFAQRYSMCINTMDANVADLKFDCYKSEKDAQNYCRDEMRDCQAACK
jgi:hypothetical protein